MYDATNIQTNTTQQTQEQVDAWKFKFNPRDSSMLITGQLALQYIAVGNASMKIKWQIPHNKYINALDFAPSAEVVATGDIDGAIKIFDVSTKQMVGKPLNLHGRKVVCLRFTPDSSGLISGSEDLHMHIVDLKSQELTLTLVNHANWITSISFNPMNPEYFVSTSLDNTLKIWKQGENKETKTIEFQSSVWGSHFSPDGQSIAVCCQDGLVSIISFVK